MKKSIKIFLILSVALMALGLILCVGSFASVGFDISRFIGVDSTELMEKNVDIQGRMITELELDDISGINAAYNVKLVPSADGDFHLSYCVYGRNDLCWEATNQVLRISAPNSEWKDIIGNVISFGSNAVPLTIEVPASVATIRCDVDVVELSCEDLTLDGDLSCLGDVSGLDLQNVAVKGNLTAESDTGEIHLENVKAGYLEADCEYGSMELTNVTADNMTLSADTGSIEMASVSARGILEVSADYGDILMDDVYGGDIRATGDTCDIEFSSLFAESNLSFAVTYGDIDGTIADAESAYTIFSEVDYGESSLSSGGSGAKILNIAVDTGDAHIRFLK